MHAVTVVPRSIRRVRCTRRERGAASHEAVLLLVAVALLGAGGLRNLGGAFGAVIAGSAAGHASAPDVAAPDVAAPEAAPRFAVAAAMGTALRELVLAANKVPVSRSSLYTAKGAIPRHGGALTGSGFRTVAARVAGAAPFDAADVTDAVAYLSKRAAAWSEDAPPGGRALGADKLASLRTLSDADVEAAVALANALDAYGVSDGARALRRLLDVNDAHRQLSALERLDLESADLSKDYLVPRGHPKPGEPELRIGLVEERLTAALEGVDALTDALGTEAAGFRVFRTVEPGRAGAYAGENARRLRNIAAKFSLEAGYLERLDALAADYRARLGAPLARAREALAREPAAHPLDMARLEEAAARSRTLLD